MHWFQLAPVIRRIRLRRDSRWNLWCEHNMNAIWLRSWLFLFELSPQNKYERCTVCWCVWSKPPKRGLNGISTRLALVASSTICWAFLVLEAALAFVSSISRLLLVISLSASSSSSSDSFFRISSLNLSFATVSWSLWYDDWKVKASSRCALCMNSELALNEHSHLFVYKLTHART